MDARRGGRYRSSMDPYELVADYYDAEYGVLETDAAWFARAVAPGSVLVLGAGSGRICRCLAPRAVTGLDLSAPMLEVARRRQPDARFVVGDMRAFDLGRFEEVVIPNASFNFLPTRADQRRCLDACRRALSEGGLLTIDMPMPDFEWLGRPHTPEALAWEGRVGEAQVRRTREVRRFPTGQRLELTDRYYVDGQFLTTSSLHLRLVFPAEVEWMLESAGFYVDALLGDYREGRLREGCPRLLVRAVAI